uniref:Uncharacterized protein n=1 Tax=Solanum tuberosum TaxID=4113 RepID=M1BQB4_SOLTU
MFASLHFVIVKILQPDLYWIAYDATFLSVFFPRTGITNFVILIPWLQTEEMEM